MIYIKQRRLGTVHGIFLEIRGWKRFRALEFPISKLHTILYDLENEEVFQFNMTDE